MAQTFAKDLLDIRHDSLGLGGVVGSREAAAIRGSKGPQSPHQSVKLGRAVEVENVHRQLWRSERLLKGLELDLEWLLGLTVVTTPGVLRVPINAFNGEGVLGHHLHGPWLATHIKKSGATTASKSVSKPRVNE